MMSEHILTIMRWAVINYERGKKEKNNILWMGYNLLNAWYYINK